MSEYMTIADMAKELNVSRQAVYQKIKSSAELSTALQQFTVKQGNKTVYSLQGQKLIRQAFENNSTVNSKPKDVYKKVSIDNSLIDILTQQIQTKDKQIEAMQAQISKLTDTVKELTTALQAAQALHGMDKQQKVIEVKEQPEPRPVPVRQPERHKQQPKKRTLSERIRDFFK